MTRWHGGGTEKYCNRITKYPSRTYIHTISYIHVCTSEGSLAVQFWCPLRENYYLLAYVHYFLEIIIFGIGITEHNYYNIYENLFYDFIMKLKSHFIIRRITITFLYIFLYSDSSDF